MSLTTYHQKRKFTQTPEPRGRQKTSGAALRFVVQKHAASRLHYDFRLELDGVMKSWAVPKGPSLNPINKRLAVMVEDHPLDYRTFEGTIPAGNYGAGTVMVWDEGFYTVVPATARSDSEEAMREGLAKGHLKLTLDGAKLKGEFSLVRLNRGKKQDWLLIKARDEWASESDVSAQDRSIVTGRDLEEIAGNVKGKRPKHGNSKNKPSPARAITNSDDGRKAPIPHHVKPMLATLVDKPFDRPGWFFEVKWDGYRAIAEVAPPKVALYSRNGNSLADRFQPIVESLRDLDRRAVLDGEVVAVDSEGRSRFQLLQNYQKSGRGQLLYYVFDLLYLDGRDLRELPLRRRKELLSKLIGGLPNVRLSEEIEENGTDFFKAATERGLEGIVAKNADSSYREGIRSQDWLKIKTHGRQEAVICGFTEPRGKREHMGALILGVYENKELIYIGHTGGGFGAKGLQDLSKQLQPLLQAKCPFKKKPKTNAPAHWVRPELVCEVSFQEWTNDGSMRQPIFLGLREDKAAHAVRREAPNKVIFEKVAPDTSKPQKSKSVQTASSRVLKSKKASAAALPAEPTLTHLEKVYWPKEGITKGDLIEYYREIAPVILSYLRDRPQSLHRFPNGIEGKSFFQKDVSHQPPPPWVATATVSSGGRGNQIEYLLCQDEPSLLYIANLGCIEVNPWNSRVGSLEEPDYVVIDLDPEAVGFEKVIETAIAVRRVLEHAEIESVCKTSGKRGLHVFIPIGPGHTTDQATQFAEIVASLVHEKLPTFTSLVRSPSLRQGKVYLDFPQNSRGQTLASAYSARPHPGATVSTPLLWKEVKKGLDPAKYTIKSIAQRLDKMGDPWSRVLHGGNDLSRCLSRLRKN
jgi:bifunctional non-homologous end joining protein LigD